MQQGRTPLSTSWSSKRCPSLSSFSGNGTRRARRSSLSTWAAKLTCSLRCFAAHLFALIDAGARRIIAILKTNLHLAVPAAMHVETRGGKVPLCIYHLLHMT